MLCLCKLHPTDEAIIPYEFCVPESCVTLHQVCIISRAYKNGRLEEERVTPIEACSPGKIIEPY